MFLNFVLIEVVCMLIYCYLVGFLVGLLDYAWWGICYGIACFGVVVFGGVLVLRLAGYVIVVLICLVLVVLLCLVWLLLEFVVEFADNMLYCVSGCLFDWLVFFGLAVDDYFVV